MRILDVSPRTSLHRGGSGTRTGNLLRHLGERHDVRRFSQPRLRDFLARRPAPGEWIHGSWRAAGIVETAERTWVTAPVLAGVALRRTRPEKLRELLDWADVTLVEFPWQVAHVARLEPTGPLVLASHNVEAQKFASYAVAARAHMTRAPWLRYIAKMERGAVKRADLIIAVKEGDRNDFVERYGVDPGKIVVAPNAADIEGLTPADLERRAAARRAFGLGPAPVAFYAGTDVPPNLRGLDWIRALAKVAEEVTFLVVGTVGGRPRREGNLVFTGPIDEIRLALDAADISLCPVEFGGGTKIKLLESLSAGVPTLAFEDSLLGLGLRDGEHLLLARRTRESLLEALRRLVNDRALRNRLGAAGRRYVAEHHDWRTSAAIVEAALQRVVLGGRPRDRVGVAV